MDKLKLIKITVFVLTFLLILGTMTFLANLYKQIHKTPVEIPSIISLNQPQGSLIQQFQQDKGIVYLLIQGGGEDDRIVIFDSNLGKNKTTLQLN